MNAPAFDRPTVPLVLFGVPFHNLTFQTTINWIDYLIEKKEPSLLATANLDFLRLANHDPEMQRILFEADIVMADGHPIVKLSSLFGPRLLARVTGSDLTPMLAEHAAKKGYRLYFLGGAPGVARKAADILIEKHPGLNIVGCWSPQKADVIEMQSDEILDDLKKTRPDILFVALGAPKQEKWIRMHRPSWDVPVAIGVGGTLDFIAGTQQRAPRWMQKLGIEWIGRLLSAPRRLAGRYLHDGMFLARTLVQLVRIKFTPARTNARPIRETTESKLFADLDAACAELKACHTQEDAEKEIQRLRDANTTGHLIITPERTDWLNSLELGVLVQMARDYRNGQRLLFVYPSNKRIEQLLKATGLHNCFPVLPNPEDIIKQLKERKLLTANGAITRDRSNRLVVSLPEELTASNKNEIQNKAIENWLDKEKGIPGEVIIDALAATFIDSAGLAMLVALKKRADREQIKISFTEFQQGPKRVIEIAHLESYLK